MDSASKVLPPYCNTKYEPLESNLTTGTNNPTLFQAVYGGKKSTRRRKWSSKYKRSINCKRPKGFSQKQYCKYGRRKRKTKNKRSKR